MLIKEEIFILKIEGIVK